MFPRKTICVLALLFSFVSLTSFVVAYNYYWYTSESVSAGLILLPVSDLNQDGTVDIMDILIVGTAFGATPSDPNWNAIADLYNDGIIDIMDVLVVAVDFGWSI